jgi:hypothetical protein
MNNENSEEVTQKERDEVLSHLPQWRRELLNLREKVDKEIQQSEETGKEKMDS